jgi:hypothetical protein
MLALPLLLLLLLLLLLSSICISHPSLPQKKIGYSSIVV